jgi:hypothetical protein
VRRLWFLVLIVGLAACGSGAESPTETPPVAEGPPALEQADDGNFTLYVSNQSFDRAQVDIAVFIDDRLAVDDDFAVENQHNWIEFKYELADGSHAIRVESIKGDAVLEKRFEVAGKRWAVIDYWCCDSGQGEPRFTFRVSNEPIAFA